MHSIRIRRERSVASHALVGLILITLGVLFLLGNMGYLQVRELLRFWPVLFMAMGVLRLLESRDRHTVVVSLLWIMTAFAFLLQSLGIINIDFEELWPIFLVAMGLLMLWRSFAGKRPPADGVNSDSTISGIAVMGGLVRRNNSQDFKGGEFCAIMGGCEIDLRNASIASGEAVIETFAFWGGIEIKVPPDWTVIGKVTPLLGGFEDSTQQPKESTKRLVVRGFAIMGGVGMKN